MKKLNHLSKLSILTLALLSSSAAYAESLQLNGTQLTTAQVAKFAANKNEKVEIAPEAAQKVSHSFDLVMEAALQGTAVYGLNVGVGWNKDKPVFKEVKGRRTLDEELLALSRRFNTSSLHAHGGGIGEAMPAQAVRAGMLIRLNEMLGGETGTQLSVVEAYRDFLNHDIIPVVPEKGSVGEADITLASHIGLAMIGEWFVDYQGKRMPAAEALKLAGLKPIEPVGKDFLSILSTNALTAGQAVLLAEETRHYLEAATAVFALSLEGYNGNVAPFLAETTELRPFPGMVKAATDIRTALDGSYLWQQSDGRALQDPLSYRTMAYALGNAWEAQAALEEALHIHINASDDNPAAVASDKPAEKAADSHNQLHKYQVAGDVHGAIYPTANFDMLPVATRVENLNVALTRLAQNIVMQTIRTENPDFTKLPRFLAGPENEGHAFGAMQKPLVALYAENRQLAMPVSLDTFAMAGNIEDTGNNAPLAVNSLQRILGNMYSLSSIQLLHSAQAVDLRGKVALGKTSAKLLETYRAQVKFVDQDRIYTPDFAAGVQVLHAFTQPATK